MIILDTDILSLVQRDDSAPGLRVRARIAQLSPEELVATTIVTYHEQTRGWLAYIAKARTKPQQVDAYALLAQHLEDYREARVIPYDHSAADVFDELRHNHPRIGTMDLRIAAIALWRGALLVTRNLNDFEKIPNLRVEDWTKP
jgi:tRNA(fMet)-specific endonuclease VapC